MDNHSKYGRFCNQVYLWLEIHKFYSRLTVSCLTKNNASPHLLKQCYCVVKACC